MSESGKNKLKDCGISPPQDEADKSVLFGEPIWKHCLQGSLPMQKMQRAF